MSFGGSVSAMNNSIKSNRDLVGKRNTFKQLNNRNTQDGDYKSEPIDKKKLKQIRKQELADISKDSLFRQILGLSLSLGLLVVLYFGYKFFVL